ncbi:hypothetical protein F4809DRAFT_618225 [Biscogniauxia mediterranea]|nr:hypothetical protein F4809DRAFT_618225 [Biscogniauxia mediterranea]
MEIHSCETHLVGSNMSLAGLTIYRIKYVFPVRLQTTYYTFSGILTYAYVVLPSSLPQLYLLSWKHGKAFVLRCMSLHWLFFLGILGMNIVSRGVKRKKNTYISTQVT